jgi:hypothetical protein
MTHVFTGDGKRLRASERPNPDVERNIAMEPAARWDNVVPPMRRNGSAWQPSHSARRKNKIRRQRVAGGRA